MDAAELQQTIDALPRVKLAQLPTPLHHATRLSEALGGPTIYIKREELTGMPLAGNKTRMMEFVVPRILAAQADCVIGGASFQSNYCRQLTAACRQFGLDVHLVLMAKPADMKPEPQGNLLLDLLLGAQVHVIEASTGDQVIAHMHDLADRLRAEGRRPYVARMANSEDTGLDAAAYVNCALELHHQLNKAYIQPDYVYLASADTTQAGLLLGAKLLGGSYRIVGVNPIDSAIFETPVPELIAQAAQRAARELGLDETITAHDVTNDPNYVGDGYAIPSPQGLEAIQMVAQMEGILLDPVYSSKAMAGLIDHIRRGQLTADDTVVFLHTGGYPALFAYADWFDFSSQMMTDELRGV